MMRRATHNPLWNGMILGPKEAKRPSGLIISPKPRNRGNQESKSQGFKEARDQGNEELR